MHPSISTLKQATVLFLENHAETLDLDPAQIASIRPFQAASPEPVPALEQICGPLASTIEETLPLCEAIQQAARHMRWRRTYSETDGFPKAFLDAYGWFDLAGPDGPFAADNLRIMFGYWGAGLHYPDHSHAQEEHYVVLAGSAWFRLRDKPFRRLGPGQIFHTPPGVVHAAEMRDEPLLAMAIWRAADLSVRINLTGSGRDVDAS